MTKEKLEYWHEKLWELIHDMGTSPIDPTERVFWAELLGAVAEATAALRFMHGDWKSTEAWKQRMKHWNYSKPHAADHT